MTSSTLLVSVSLVILRVLPLLALFEEGLREEEKEGSDGDALFPARNATQRRESKP